MLFVFDNGESYSDHTIYFCDGTGFEKEDAEFILELIKITGQEYFELIGEAQPLSGFNNKMPLINMIPVDFRGWERGNTWLGAKSCRSLVQRAKDDLDKGLFEDRLGPDILKGYIQDLKRRVDEFFAYRDLWAQAPDKIRPFLVDPTGHEGDWTIYQKMDLEEFIKRPEEPLYPLEQFARDVSEQR